MVFPTFTLYFWPSPAQGCLPPYQNGCQGFGARNKQGADRLPKIALVSRLVYFEFYCIHAGFALHKAVCKPAGQFRRRLAYIGARAALFVADLGLPAVFSGQAERVRRRRFPQLRTGEPKSLSVSSFKLLLPLVRLMPHSGAIGVNAIRLCGSDYGCNLSPGKSTSGLKAEVKAGREDETAVIIRSWKTLPPPWSILKAFKISVPITLRAIICRNTARLWWNAFWEVGGTFRTSTILYGLMTGHVMTLTCTSGLKASL